MDSMKNLKRVCESIIVPQYSELDSVDVRIVAGSFDIFFYEVIYYYNTPLDVQLKVEIMTETVALFNMLGFPKGSDLTVTYTEKESTES